VVSGVGLSNYVFSVDEKIAPWAAAKLKFMAVIIGYNLVATAYVGTKLVIGSRNDVQEKINFKFHFQ